MAPQPDAAREEYAGDGAPATEARAAERSAERAATLAATEGFHPLRLRPYVAEPGGEAGETTVRPLLSPSFDGGPAEGDLGLFPEAYSGVEYPAELPGEFPGGFPGEFPGEFPGGGDTEPAAAHGRHRRRRRGIVVAAAAVAASALAAGAVAVTGQVMGDEPRTDRAMPPDRSAAVPDVELPTEIAGVSGTATEAAARRVPAQRAAPTTSAPPSATASAPSPTATASTTPPPTTAGTASPTATVTTTAPSASPSDHVASPATAGPPVLQQGDTGAAVADLQQRLIDVWVYHGRVDGTFDRGVERAVALFQIWYGVQGDASGVYGPHTRAALEHQTS
ncbi:peptidoglycan-binding domain-containing protein [Actinacidiphila alni]|uniref:peptidoglycan-binding domain-containing protein n=1 Tax=Actinacidiphila alni TaxID=380248 RepID=UPI003453210E